ncbi:MAG: cysteine desulfurase [Candidatus Eisenbacteria bacterium]|uniref:Cysteine desulfurase n=1 Tax=Eiseniibacteriota bacterium TaxID=2212470 RepID=A0A948RTR9_UNCEI|nr:cysteine desulfurase [Candidatus Eisenbacteria bacterium]MBU1949857.1 cysteine desulfurase [Candidatus Eisenbacteria bacterium]MBU2690860.1 cysteine desulfurase [Candidatus Eisenbacteria bacterium]
MNKTINKIHNETRPPLDMARIRGMFPILSRRMGGLPLIYLDSAATTHKPRQVIDAVSRFYEESNANVHRGVHRLSAEATEAFETAREKIRRHLGAREAAEVIWVRGATEAINLVAQSWGRPRLGPGDEILVTEMEHHSNIVPWQMLGEQTGAALKVAPIADDGSLPLDAFSRMLSQRTRMVAVAHASNALGTINPIRRMVDLAHAVGAVVLVDGAQAAAHLPIDVTALDCDFYAISAHKMFGPTGIGALYGKRKHLESMPPWMGGGDMISNVSFQGTTYNEIPFKFEAGTPHIAGAIGMGAAVDFIEEVGLDIIAAHERDLLETGTRALENLDGLTILGRAPEKTAILSFVMDGIHPHDVGTILDGRGIAVRTGHHCAQPVLQHFNVPATTRASLSIYNLQSDLEALVEGLREVRALFS